MTMHLERGLTTTSTKKRKDKMTKARLAELEQGWRDRNVRLKEMRLPKETFEQYLEWVYGKGKKAKGSENIRAETPKAVSKLAKEKDQDKGERKSVKEITEAKGASDQSISAANKNSTRSWITGPCTIKQTPTYTGNKILGIATMHKSNAVPVFSDTEAKEVSSMRR